MSEALIPDEPSFHAKLDELLVNQKAMWLVVNQVQADVSEQGTDVKKMTERLDKMDLNGSAQTLKAMARPDGPVAALVAVAPDILNRMTFSTEDQKELYDYSLTHAGVLNVGLPLLPEMAASYKKEREAKEKKQQFRAEVWDHLAAPFRRFGKLGGVIGAVALTAFGAVLSEVLQHVHW